MDEAWTAAVAKRLLGAEGLFDERDHRLRGGQDDVRRDGAETLTKLNSFCAHRCFPFQFRSEARFKMGSWQLAQVMCELKQIDERRIDRRGHRIGIPKNLGDRLVELSDQ